MSGFFDNLPPEDAEHIDRMAKFTYELRENHALLLKKYGVTEEAELLQLIKNGVAQEHPAYEDYLSMCMLEQTRQLVRAEIQEYLAGVQAG